MNWGPLSGKLYRIVDVQYMGNNAAEWVAGGALHVIQFSEVQQPVLVWKVVQTRGDSHISCAGKAVQRSVCDGVPHFGDAMAMKTAENQLIFMGHTK